MPGWPADLRGITEVVITTRREDGSWNVAALGLDVPEDGPEERTAVHDQLTARTWGQTRTKEEFERDGRGYVQFTRDPVVFVKAALESMTTDDPILPSADAWTEVSVTRLDTGTEGGTTWTDWALEPVETGVERRVVPTVNRGFSAVVEATVAASRLGVETYDTGRLRDRIDYFETVAKRCGGPREREAFERLREFQD